MTVSRRSLSPTRWCCVIPAASTLQIFEQNYEGDPVSEQSLMKLFAGKVIDFEVTQVSGSRPE